MDQEERIELREIANNNIKAENNRTHNKDLVQPRKEESVEKKFEWWKKHRKEVGSEKKLQEWKREKRDINLYSNNT